MIESRAIAAIGLLFLLTGCAAEGIEISDGDRALPKCSGIATVTVESLDDTDEATCDLDGIELTFPDGFQRAAPQIGNSAASGSPETNPEVDEIITYSLWNIGIDGVVAARTNFDGSQTEWWGTTQGIERVRQAFGDPRPIYQRL